MKIVVAGEVLWDEVVGAEYLGGAPFNFAAHAANLGHEASFVSAIGADPRGRRILARMGEMNLSARYITTVPELPTGCVTASVDFSGQPSFQIHRPAAYDFPALSEVDFASLVSPAPDWIYFGTLAQMSAPAKKLFFRLLDAAPGAHRFYDVNLRHNSYTPELLDELMSRATIVKFNDREIDEVAHLFGHPNLTFQNFCRSYAEKYSWEGVCITRGADGCTLLLGGKYIESRGFHVKVADTIGAGDAFAAGFVHGLGCQ
ncbi:MAG: carbohydrate kinase family protein, partial [Candidatus Binataceae bacterium]